MTRLKMKDLLHRSPEGIASSATMTSPSDDRHQLGEWPPDEADGPRRQGAHLSSVCVHASDPVQYPLSPGWGLALVAISLALATIGAAERLHNNNDNNYSGTQDSLIYSPSPRDFIAFRSLACHPDSRVRMSKEELLRVYENSSSLGSASMRKFIKRTRLDRECRREDSAWRFQYVDEAGGVLVRDDSIDERLANVVYTARTAKAFAIDAFVYDSGDPAQDARNMELAAGPQVDDEQCRAQLGQMLRLLADLQARVRARRAADPEAPAVLSNQHISLAKVLDSFGRYQSGHLFGRIFVLGSYDQCRLNRLMVNETSELPMRFCYANMALTRHLDKSLSSRFRDSLETPLDVLAVSVCIPRACHSKSLDKSRAELQALLDSQFKLPDSMYVDETLPLQSLYCLVDEDSAYRVPPAGRLLLGALLLWLALAVWVTLRNRRRRRASRASHYDNLNGRAQASPGSGEPRASKRLRADLLDNLDLLDSWREFMSARELNAGKSRSRPVELATLNIVKVLGCTFVVIAHSFALFVGFSQDEIYSSHMMETDPIVLGILAGTLIVDTFFAITGILWAYFTLKRFHKQDNRARERHELADLQARRLSSLPESQLIEMPSDDAARAAGANPRPGHCATPSRQTPARLPTDGLKYFCLNWFALTAFRYLRIVPLFVLFHWFKKYVYIYAGSGPLWDHGFNGRSFNGACKAEPAWVPFTFASAYLPLSHQCILQSWSISNDMYFAILAPPIIWLIYKRPPLAMGVTTLSCLASYAYARWAVSTVPSYLDEEARELRAHGFYRFFDKLSFFYSAPHYRIFCFLAGIWGGYLLHKYQLMAESGEQPNSGDAHNGNSGKTKRTRIKWPAWITGPGTWLSVVYIFCVFAAFINRERLILYLDPIYRQVYPEFMSNIRFSWALSNVILFLRMMTDWNDNFWMRAAASKFWLLASKLNYAVLLLHMDLLLFTIQSSQTPQLHMTTWAFFNLGAGVLLTCVPLAIVVTVVYENTVDKLIRAMLPVS